MSSFCEFSGITRLHLLFNRMLGRYGRDVRLWLQYIDFCKRAKSNKALGKVFGRAIQAHPTNTALWILAASWEFEENNNITAARVLLQRALRLNNHSARLWYEYCRLELAYRNQVIERMEIFGINAGALTPSGTSIDINALDAHKEVSETKKSTQAGTGADTLISTAAQSDPSSETALLDSFSLETTAQETSSSSASEASNAFLEGAIPLLIYQNATKAIKGFKFRAGFISIFQSFDRTEHLVNRIYDDLKATFDRSPTCWKFCAGRKLRDLANLRRRGGTEGLDPLMLTKLKEEAITYAMQTFETAVQNVNRSLMWREYLAFCVDLLEHDSEFGKYLELGVEGLEAHMQRIENVCRSAYEAGVSDEAIYGKWIQVLLDQGQITSALNVCQKAIAAWSQNSFLWLLYLKTTVRHKALSVLIEALKENALSPTLGLTSKGNPVNRTTAQHSLDEEVEKLFDRAFESVPAWKSFPIWSFFFELCFIQQVNLDKILAYFQRMMLALSGSDKKGMTKLKEDLLAYTALSHDIDAVRRIYESALPIPPTSQLFYERCLEIEKAQPSCDPQRIRYLYQRATKAYGKKATDIWLAWIRFEMNQGDFKAANTLYWEAQKPDRKSVV